MQNENGINKLIKQQKIIVVGVCQAGIAIIGALLDFGYQNIIWIDKRFCGGDFQYFISIPSNIPYFIAHILASKFQSFNSFRKSPIQINYQNQECCNNDDIRQILVSLTNIVKEHYSERVMMIKDQVIEIKETDNQFLVKIKNENKTFSCEKIFINLGGNSKKLKNYKPEIQRLDLYSVLSPILIEKYDFTDQIIQVHGSRHSSILALKNLVEMKKPPKKIYNFVKYQYEFFEIKDGVVLNPGINGVSKQFGIKYLNGEYSHIIEKHFNLIDIPETTKIIEAIGFQPRIFNFVSKTNNPSYQIIGHSLFTEGRQVKNCYISGMMAPYDKVQAGQKFKTVIINYVAQKAYEKIKSLQNDP